MNKILLFSFLAFVLTSCGFKSKEASLIVHNGTIYAVDDEFSTFQAMAIVGDSIVAMGPEREILNEYHSEQFLDLKGAIAYPGFIDAHSHLSGYGFSVLNIDLRDASSEKDLANKVSKYVKTNTAPFVFGGRWDESNWEDKKIPSRKAIDSISSTLPIVLNRVDGHSAIANKEALDLAGITKNTVIEGGYIDYETGLIKETAIGLVANALPELGYEEFKKAIKTASKNCHAAGLTTVCDAGLDPDEIEHYMQLYNNGELNIRTYAMSDPSPANFKRFTENGTLDADFLKLYSIKAYGDGSLGSRSAALLQEYHDDHGNDGILTLSADSINEIATRCAALGIQLNTHCIGDRALRSTLECYSKHLKPMNDERWRIEHVQVVNPEDLHYFSEYGIVPSVQPTHATSDSKWAADRLGNDRLKTAYAYQTLKQQLGWIALGTDFPVEDINPVATYYAAVFRKALLKPQSTAFLPEEALSRKDALKGITLWAALSMKMEDEVGSLEVGKKADFVVLNSDLLKIEEKDFQKVRVLHTYINGEKVFEAL